MVRARHSIVLLALLAGCGGPVKWEQPSTIMAPPEGARLVLDGAPPRWAAAERPSSLPETEACPGSMQAARMRGTEWFAVWWAPRPDSSARLEAARSTDGGRSWPERAPVDTIDRATVGCRRPPPALATDSVSQYVHVAYWLLAPEGSGVFFSHSMPGHFMFHAPVPVMYGERAVRTSVGADANLVIVAYEDPNAVDPEVWVGLSHTQGHLFAERVPASTSGGAAAPAVAVRGRRVAVAWERRDRSGGGNVAGASREMLVRLGEVKE